MREGRGFAVHGSLRRRGVLGRRVHFLVPTPSMTAVFPPAPLDPFRRVFEEPYPATGSRRFCRRVDLVSTAYGTANLLWNGTQQIALQVGAAGGVIAIPRGGTVTPTPQRWLGLVTRALRPTRGWWSVEPPSDADLLSLLGAALVTEAATAGCALGAPRTAPLALTLEDDTGIDWSVSFEHGPRFLMFLHEGPARRGLEWIGRSVGLTEDECHVARVADWDPAHDADAADEPAWRHPFFEALRSALGTYDGGQRQRRGEPVMWAAIHWMHRTATVWESRRGAVVLEKSEQIAFLMLLVVFGLAVAYSVLAGGGAGAASGWR